MRRIAAPLLLATLACALAAAGCGGASKDSPGGDAPGVREVGETARALAEFTEELASKVEKAGDAKAGLADAQRLLDARRGELAASVSALRASPRVKSDASARGRLLEAEVDNTERVHRLQIKYADATTADADFKARLDKLVSDYDSIFR